MTTRWLLDLLDLALPHLCAGCRAPGRALCAACTPPLPFVARTDPVPVAAAGDYDGGLRRALLAYKERGRLDLAGPLAALLGEALTQLAVEAPGEGPARLLPWVLVPVPSSAAARRSRGRDHVRVLARRAGRGATLGRRGAAAVRPLAVVPALRPVRTVRDSAGLGAEARERNLHGAFRAAVGDGTRAAVVVDDIVTTGATLREATRALRAAGWPVAGAVVVAATRRRRPSFSADP